MTDTPESFRFEVTAVFTITGRGTVAAGVVESGVVCIGDVVEVRHGDGRRLARCAGVELMTSRPPKSPRQIGLLLPDLELADICPGDIIVSTSPARSGCGSW
jgi:translation elongation factor EF-Tu-like GTPase